MDTTVQPGPTQQENHVPEVFHISRFVVSNETRQLSLRLERAESNELF